MIKGKDYKNKGNLSTLLREASVSKDRKLEVRGHRTQTEIYVGDGSVGQEYQTIYSPIGKSSEPEVYVFTSDTDMVALTKNTILEEDTDFTWDADTQTLTFGNGNAGYMPDTNEEILIVYTPVLVTKLVTAYRVTGAKIVADDYQVDGAVNIDARYDDPMGKGIIVDSTHVTGTTDFDVKVVKSPNGTNFSTSSRCSLVESTFPIAEMGDQYDLLTSAKWLRFLIDINTTTLPALEYLIIWYVATRTWKEA